MMCLCREGIMGNTSDRVSGPKPHRSDSAGHKDLEPSKMMDSTDDPNIFNTHGPEYKVCTHVCLSSA